MSDTTGTFSNSIRVATIQWLSGDVVGLTAQKPEIAFKLGNLVELLAPVPVVAAYTENTTARAFGLSAPIPNISILSLSSVGSFVAEVSTPDVSIVSRFTIGIVEVELPAAGVSVFSKYTVGMIVIEAPVPSVEGSAFGTYGSLSLYPESPNLEVDSYYTNGGFDVQISAPEMYMEALSTHNPISVYVVKPKIMIGGRDGTGGVMKFTLEVPGISITKNENTNWPLITMTVSMPELFMSEDF